MRKLLLVASFLFGAALGGCVTGCKKQHQTCPGLKREPIPEPALIPPTDLPTRPGEQPVSERQAKLPPARRWVD